MAVRINSAYDAARYYASRTTKTTSAKSTSNAAKSSSSAKSSAAANASRYVKTSSKNASSATNNRKSTSAVANAVPAVKSTVNKNVKTNVTVSKSASTNVLKGTGIGLNQNPLANTKFKVDWSINANNPQGATVFKMYDMTAGRLKNGVPVGDSVFRVDMPHTGCKTNHININEGLYKSNSRYQALNHQKISATTYKAAGNASKISKVAKVGGKALCAIAIVSDANDIYNSFKSDNNTIGKKTITTSSGVAGSWIGAAGGAKAGATLGATIGSFICPGLGTAIGGTIGGILGGIGGSIGGRALGEEAAKAIMN